MRAVDDNSPRYAAVLRTLRTWKQLPESDLARMLPTLFLVTDDLRDMEELGYLTLSFVGDEFLIAPTTLGRLWLEQYEAGEQNHVI